MTDICTEERRAIDWVTWLARAEELPCAAYAVRHDEWLTLLGGNQAFYRLFACSEQSLRLKYGGRLGALVDAEPLRQLFLREQTGPLSLCQRISRAGAPAWIETQLWVCPDDGGQVLCCLSFDVTQSQRAAQRLGALEETVGLLVDRGDLDYFEYDLATGAAQLHTAQGLLPPDLAGRDGRCSDFLDCLVDREVVRPGFEDGLRAAFQEVRGPESRAVCELGLNHARRGLIWARLTLSLKQGGRQVVGIWEDITREREAARNYLNETQFYQAMLSEKAAYAQVDVTEDRITRIGGMWNLYNEIIDQVTYSQLIQQFINKVVHPEDRKHYLEVMQCSNFTQSLDSGIDRLGCEFRRIVDQNKMMWMELSVFLFRDPLTRHIQALLTIKNIDAQKKQELLLLHDARMDQLTNVYGRRVATALIRDYLGGARPDELCALAVLSVDDFPRLNGVHGSQEGDRVLLHLSHMLGRAFRRSDIVGRLGGERFVIFLKNVEEQERVSGRMSGLYGLLRRSSDLGPIACSAGVALTRGPASFEPLFRQAGLALHRASRDGKDRYCFYQPEDELLPPLEDAPDEPSDAPSSLLPQQMDPPGSMEEHSFDRLLSAQGDIAYLVNPDTFDLICGNQAFYDRLGTSQAQCTDLKCYEVMQKRDTPCPFCSKANWSADKFYLWRNLNRALEQEFLIKNKLVPWGGRQALLAIAVDLSNDKSIVDSMDSSASETHSLLSGVQRMAEAPLLSDAMESALETIGCFFRADAVRLWQHDGAGGCICPYRWTQGGQADGREGQSAVIARWLEGRDWTTPLVVESAEAMLGHSYDMYRHMKEHGIRNQRWVRIAENGAALGYLAIDNLSSSFQNMAFLDSFCTFMASEMKKRGLMERALYADQHDDLTDLLSRKSFEGFMLTYQPDQLACVGVVMANFNNLKGVNSTRGFQTGNYYIKQFADLLRAAFPTRQLYRLNGDEFLVVLPDATRSVLEEGVAALERQVRDCGTFSVSMGHAWDDVENDLPILIEQATQAMKVNKKRHYDSSPSTADEERRRMLSELVSSIERREFEVFLQPKVELRHGTVVGAEALIRYHHKELGYIGPAQFIDMLEKNNLIRYIDLFVFEEVCRTLEDWKRQGLNLPTVSLNFSRLTLLERNILSSMESIISRYDVRKQYVEVEITESVTGMGKGVLYQAVCNLSQAGFAISLDDFGTKYTNLAILADLDFSMLKIDKSLVSELGRGDNHRLIMQNIISMCRDLNISVLAEGIERKDQEEILQDMQCQLGQGYLYGKPMPIEEFTRRHLRPAPPSPP